MKRAGFWIAASLLASALAGCGGGGASGTAVAGAAYAPASSPSTQDQASAQIADQVNAARAQCGFPVLAASAPLMQAAQAHAVYMADAGATSHSETKGHPGFTGSTISARYVAAGWIDGGEEYVTSVPSFAPVASATVFASLPLHADLFASGQGWMAVGVAVAGGRDYVDIEVGSPNQSQTGPLSGDLPMTFPCQGMTGVPPQSLDLEYPAPLGIDTQTDPMGAPIVVTGSPGQTLEITQALVRPASPGTGAGVTLDVLDAGNEPGDLQSWQAVVVPSAPLSLQTDYQAQITGTLDGAAFSRTFTFTTGG